MMVDPRSQKNDVSHQFRVKLINEAEDLSDCILISNTSEFGVIGTNVLIELIWNLKMEPIGFIMGPNKVNFPMMVKGRPSTTFTIYRKNNLIAIPMMEVIPAIYVEGIAEGISQWVKANNFKEFHIISAVKIRGKEPGLVFRLFTNTFLNRNKKDRIKYLVNGIGVGGIGGTMFLTNEWYDLSATGTFVNCIEDTDNENFMMTAMEVTIELLELDFDLENWFEEYEEFKSGEITNDESDSTKSPERSLDFI